MNDLAAWLLERIAEDDQLANAREYDGLSVDGSWHTRTCGYRQGEWQEPCDCDVPARIAAECDTKRQLVDLHQRIWLHPGAEYFNDAHLTKEPMPICASCVPERQFRRATSWPCRTLKVMALPYVGQPGYLEEWRA